MTVEKRINYGVNKGDINEGPKSPQQIAGGEYNRVLKLLEKVRENIPLTEKEKIELQSLIRTLTAKGIDVEQLTGGPGKMRMTSVDRKIYDKKKLKRLDGNVIDIAPIIEDEWWKIKEKIKEEKDEGEALLKNKKHKLLAYKFGATSQSEEDLISRQFENYINDIDKGELDPGVSFMKYINMILGRDPVSRGGIISVI